MKPEHNVRDTYADLLEGDNPHAVKAVGILDSLYTPGPMPATARAHIAGRLLEQASRPNNPLRWTLRQHFTLSFRGVMALLLVSSLVAAATPSVVSLIERALSMSPSTRSIVERQLGQTVNLPQTVGGFTITIGRVMVDANQVVIGYTVTGPPGRSFRNFSLSPNGQYPTLSDDHGRRYVAETLSYFTAVEGESSGGVLIYQGTGKLDVDHKVGLRLDIAGVTATEQVGALPSASGPAVSGWPCNEQSQPLRCLTIVNRLTFNFSVPVEAARVVELQQSSANASGATVTLERVVVTQTETRISVSGEAPFAVAQLSVGGKTYELRQTAVDQSGLSQPNLTTFIVPASLLDQYGDWKLIVKDQATQVMPSQGDSWFFQFIVP